MIAKIAPDLRRVFDYAEASPWPDNTPDDVVIKCATRAVADMLKSNDFCQQPRIYRLAGQSGTGKTTQLLPTVTKIEEMRGNKPVTIAVRNFYTYHPQYKQLLAEHGTGEIRERTNGFALKCLAVAVKQILEMGYLTILDVTILAPQFEEFINTQIQSNGYTAQYHIMAVNRRQSEIFIRKRKGDIASVESGRAVHKATANYFYDILPRGLEYLGRTDRRSTAIVWTAYDKVPIYRGDLRGAHLALTRGRRVFTPTLIYTEDDLRQSKLEFLYLYLYQVPYSPV